jgi:starch-binding outer membrane protein, SusD/RagB family
MNRKQWGMALALVFALGACDDMLVEEPRSFITTATYYNTVDDLERGMLAGWASIRAVVGAVNGTWWGSVGNMSDQERVDPTEVNIQRNIGRLDWTAANMPQLDGGWQNLLRAVYRENIVISRADAVTAGDQTRKAQVLAEAKVLRAFSYFWLDRMHSGNGTNTSGAGKLTDLSVPLYLTESDHAVLDVQRATVQQIHDAIIKDLTEAEAILPTATQRGTAGRGRPTKGAAQMILADLYLWRSSYLGTGEWNKVLEWTGKVIASGEYSLVQTGWFNVFNPGAKAANRENIFFMVATGSPGRQTSVFINLYGPRILGFNVGGGFGTNQVTDWQLGIYANGDIRGRVGPVPVVGTRQSDTVAYRNYGCSTGAVRGFTDQGGRCGPVQTVPYKFRATDLIAANGDVDVPYYRYAETLLMQAEALNELGRTAEAVARLNEVRARARRGATGTENRVQPADLAGGLSLAQMRDSVFIERSRELSHEAKRWLDMVRRDSMDPGYWAAALRHDPQTFEIIPNVDQQLFKKRLPVPQREIDLNPALVQNAGY